MMLAAASSFKGKSDRDKYRKAMRLKGCIGKIRADYKKNLKSKDTFNRQLATAMCAKGGGQRASEKPIKKSYREKKRQKDKKRERKRPVQV